MMKGFFENRYAKAALWLVFLSAAFSVFFTPIYNYDIFWHLSAGKYIWKNLAVPGVDFLSWTERGSRWTDFEWLSQALYWGVYSLGGFKALYALKMILLLALFYVFRRIIRFRRIGGAFFAYPAFALLVFPNADLRAENFSLLFFAFVLAECEGILEDAKSPGKGKHIMFFALFSLWANLHGGFPFGLLLLFFYFAGEMADSFFRGKGKSRKKRAGRAGKYLSLLAVSFAGTLINPFGTGIYDILAEHYFDMKFISRYIIEWMPSRFDNPFHWPYAFSLFAFFACMVYIVLKRKDFRFAHLFSVLFFAVLSSQHTRHIAFFGVAAAFSVTYYLKGRDFSRRNAAVNQAVLLAVFCAYCVLYVWKFTFRALVIPAFPGKSAVSFLEKNREKLSRLRMYNPWKWGGFLGFYLGGEYRVFVDGRYIFHKYLAEIDFAETAPRLFDRFAEKYSFGLLILERNYRAFETLVASGGKKYRIMRPQYVFFQPRRKWALVYWDANSLVFARRNAVPPEWLEKNEYRFFLPDDFAYSKLMSRDGEYAEGMEREIKRRLSRHKSPLERKYVNYFKEYMKKPLPDSDSPAGVF